MENFEHLRHRLVGPFCPRCGTEIRIKEPRCTKCNWPYPEPGKEIGQEISQETNKENSKEHHKKPGPKPGFRKGIA